MHTTRFGASENAVSLTSISRHQPLPASAGQAGLWHTLASREPYYIYNEQLEFRIDGKLDPQLLQRCMNALVERHEALRATFTQDTEGRLLQVINEPYDVELTVIPVGDDDMDEAALEREIRRVSLEQGRRRYDLFASPPFRTCLLQLPDDKQVFWFQLPHIVVDGASTVVMFEDWRLLDQALSRGTPPQLTPLPFQFVDYAAWEQRYLASEAAAPARRYWQQTLLDTPDPLALPYDRPWSAQVPMHGEWEAVVVPAELVRQLAQLRKKAGVTDNTLLLAALKVLLMRYTGQSDLCVGSLRANRPFAALKNTVGYYVNNITIRSKLCGDMSFEQLLKSVKTQVKAAGRRYPLPYSTQIDIARANGRPVENPLCQVVLDYGGIPFEPFSFSGGQTVSRVQYCNLGSAKFEIALSLLKVGDRLEGHFEYNKALFDRSTIQRLKQHYLQLLQSVAANPQQSIATVPFLSAAEQRLILQDWNHSETSSYADQSIHARVERRAEQAPDAIALQCQNQQLSYGEFNRRSNRLANYLIGQGLGPEAKVGLSLNRSIDMVVALLGILKAGAAYVPIDATTPVDRLRYIVAQSELALLLSEAALLDGLDEALPVRCICLDRQWPAIAAHCGENPRLPLDPHNLAYMIYTSGSTGRPKGTLTTHANVLRLFSTTEALYPFNAGDVWTLFHSFAFDFSVWELWGALFYGGKLIVVPHWVSRDTGQFCKLVHEQEVTVLNQTPSAFKQFIAAEKALPAECGPPSLRYVIFGGEALDIAALQPWFEQRGGRQAQLINMYGITETTVHVTHYPIDAQDTGQAGSVIGRKLPDLQTYILDAHLQAVPVGVAGELHVGGAGLARGYHKQARLSAQRFIPDPFSREPGARLYKTGDLARYRPDGNLEYLGRIDQQVKIRGFRIELGEIEHALIKLPAISEAVVTAYRRTGGDASLQLAAYVVGHRAANPSHSELRKHLQQYLPDYMVPAFFVFLDRLPLTPNGKIDRKALPKPDQTTAVEQHYLAPSTAVERKLAAIWARVLRIEAAQISAKANFLELGGDSILGLQVISQAREQGLQLSARQLFEHPTIAELALVAGQTTAVKAEQGQVGGSLPLTPIQHWFFDKVTTDISHYNQAFMLKVPAALHRETLSAALQALLLHHDALRLRFEKKDGRWTQTLAHWQAQDCLHDIDLSSLAGEAQLRRLEHEATRIQQQLDIECGPILQAALFYLGEKRQGRLLIAIHHLAVDGVSWRILLADLAEAYRQLEQGRPVRLPEKTTSYKAWAQQLQAYSRSDSLLAERNYWCQLAQYKPRLLPQDRHCQAQANTVGSSQRVGINLSREDTGALLQKVPAAYGTQINDVLLTALVLAFRQWTQDESLLLDLEGHGREDILEHADLSRTVGWFTAIYPVRLSAASATDLGESLKAVKEQLRQIPKRGTGYGLLRYCAGDAATTAALASLPAAQVSFNYLGQFDQIVGSTALLQWADEAAGESLSPQQIRTHLLEVLGLIMDDRLQLRIIYSQAHYNRDTIEQLGANLLRALQDLIAYCSMPETFGYTPSDFADADMTSEELDDLMESLGADQ